MSGAGVKALNGINNIVHKSGNETITGDKSFKNGLFQNIHYATRAVSQTNRYNVLKFTSNTTQFVKFKVIDYINNTQSAYTDGIIFWNGSEGNCRVYVKIYAENISAISNRIKWFIDSNNKFNLIYDIETYHSCVILSEISRSWANVMDVELTDYVDFDTSTLTLHNISVL